MHFSEIIKLQFGKNATHLFAFYGLLNNRCLIISKKMHGSPQFSFWIAIALAKIRFSRIVINRAKIMTSVLVGTVLRQHGDRSFSFLHFGVLPGN